MKPEYKKQVAKALLEAASVLSAASSVHLISEDGDDEMLFEQAHDLFNSQGIHLHNGYDRFFVLVDDADDERVIATAAMCLYDTDEPPSIEFSVAVAPDQQRKGLAKKLVEEVIRYTQQSSTEFGWGDDTEVEAYVANEQAMIPLLRGLGFEPSATDPKRWRRKASAVVSATSVKANYDQYRKKLMANNKAIREVVNIEDVEKAIQSAEAPVSRMAGGCYAWAIAIKRVLLPEGHLVAAVNKAVFDDSLSLVGHAAVVVGDPESEGSTWFDSEGRTNRENVESWGMLDPSEGEWEHYDRPGSLEDWIEKAAYESELLVFDNEDELLEYLPEEVKRQADRVEKALRSIKDSSVKANYDQYRKNLTGSSTSIEDVNYRTEDGRAHVSFGDASLFADEEGAAADLQHESGLVAYLHDIESAKPGGGTRLMQQIISDMKKRGVETFALQPIGYARKGGSFEFTEYGDPGHDRLVRFYERFGFKIRPTEHPYNNPVMYLRLK